MSCPECGSRRRHRKACSRFPTAPSERELLLAIATAAGRLRDFAWDTDDPGLVMNGLDRAVDAWRRHYPRK